jgi:hypothetical protein
MTEKTPEKDRKMSVFRHPYLKIVIAGGFWLSLMIFGAVSYGNELWL